MVLIQSWPPHLALAPIAQVDPPMMPFRDAGYSQADYGITVQDVVYGVWKAKDEACCVLESFDLDEYERYERVEHGDFNWITPHFLAFASPQHSPVARINETSELWDLLPKTRADVDAHPTLPQPFKNVLKHFSDRNIGLVVRLNSALYSPSFFESLGIKHLDMIFEDGTCPPLSTVRKFIQLAHATITQEKKGIAVHCKAGLGRTGCLIGAYLIYRHGFTANEIIAYMRFMRPGMVVGPQQHWLHINQGVFRQWWIEERLERKLRKEFHLAAAVHANQPSTPIRAMREATLGRSGSKNGTSTPPNRAGTRTPLGELDQDHVRGKQEDYLPAPTPGQPRKGQHSVKRHHPYNRSGSGSHHPTVPEEDSAERQLETEVVSVHRKSQEGESDEEFHLRMRSHRKASASASPERRDRSVSHHTTTTSTTTTTTVYSPAPSSTTVLDNDSAYDAENIGASIGRTNKAVEHLQRSPQRASSASGVLTKVRNGLGGGSIKRSQTAASTVREAGVRKTSGRMGTIASATNTSAASAARKISGV